MWRARAAWTATQWMTDDPGDSLTARIGIDVGGTFTDLIHYDEHTATVTVHKVPTVTEEPARGCLTAVFEAVPTKRLSDVRYLLYGTTVGLNALIERRGAIVGLLATRGFRDMLDLRRGARQNIYDIFWRPPPALVPRRLRLPITERLRADGTVHVPVALDEVRAAAARFMDEGVTSVAIAFLHAYANPAHELAAEAELRAAGFDGDITLSHQVSGEYREFERTSTTVIDAFVRGRIVADLGHVERRLRGAGFDGELMVPRSGGGSMSFAEAGARPFEVIQSGPVGGAEGAGHLARMLDLGDVITADVGGTSFDTCVVQGGSLPLLYQGSVTNLPVLCPWVDVRSIGAGGGSIVSVDAGGLIQVGPRSAGAVPGPACYGRGGTEPTLTDAAVLLGMLGDGRLASGLQVDHASARRALEPVAKALGSDLDRSAQGAILIAAHKMANAIREITIECGLDPRAMTLLPFGGAGPMFATLLAQELGVRRIVVPLHAGNFSAWGMLGADLVRTASATRILDLADDTPARLTTILDGLFSRLHTRRDGLRGAAASVREVVLDVRYKGQEHTLPVTTTCDDDGLRISARRIRQEFEDGYRRAFGSDLGNWPLEVVTVRATLRESLQRLQSVAPKTVSASRAENAIDGYSFMASRWLPFAVIDRAALTVGATIDGPAIIQEATATTYLDTGFTAQVDGSGCLFINGPGSR